MALLRRIIFPIPTEHPSYLLGDFDKEEVNEMVSWLNLNAQGWWIQDSMLTLPKTLGPIITFFELRYA